MSLEKSLGISGGQTRDAYITSEAVRRSTKVPRPFPDVGPTMKQHWFNFHGKTKLFNPYRAGSTLDDRI